MTHLPLPLVCLTYLPPWPQAMMHAGKNIENRDASVAARLAPFVGQNIGISQSKKWDEAQAKDDLWHIAAHIGAWRDESRRSALEEASKTAGKLLLVARLDRIAKPSEYGRNPWHVAGQHGLVLGKVWQVEPITCTGGAGAWEPTWCIKCGHIVADNACAIDRKTKAAKPCPKCKAIWPENRMTSKGMEHLNIRHNAGIERPQLRIVRECQ